MTKQDSEKPLTDKQKLFCQEMRFYVYALVDPRNDEIFYIGKGCGKRVSVHVRDAIKGKILNAEKHKRIQAIIDAGLQVQERIIESGMTEASAFKLERELIREMKSRLSNIQNGIMTNVEINIVRAEAILKKLKPFDVWVATITKEAKEQTERMFGSLEKFYGWYVDSVNEVITRERRAMNHGR